MKATSCLDTEVSQTEFLEINRAANQFLSSPMKKNEMYKELKATNKKMNQTYCDMDLQENN